MLREAGGGHALLPTCPAQPGLGSETQPHGLAWGTHRLPGDTPPSEFQTHLYILAPHPALGGGQEVLDWLPRAAFPPGPLVPATPGCSPHPEGEVATRKPPLANILDTWGVIPC